MTISASCADTCAFYKEFRKEYVRERSILGHPVLAGEEYKHEG